VKAPSTPTRAVQPTNKAAAVAATGERLKCEVLGEGAIEPLRPPCGFDGPPAYGITRKLMTG